MKIRADWNRRPRPEPVIRRNDLEIPPRKRKVYKINNQYAAITNRYERRPSL